MNEKETRAGLPPTAGYRYSSCVGDQLYVAGQVPQDSSGSIVGIGDPFAQASQCLSNLKRLLACHEFREQDIRHLSIYVVGPRANLHQAWNAILKEFSNDVPPATLIGVSTLGHEDQLVEIDAKIAKNPLPE